MGYRWYNLGDMTNVATFLIMVFGILLQICNGKTVYSRYILAFGLFGFAGTLTKFNKLLFTGLIYLISTNIFRWNYKLACSQNVV
jgi:hypothetical protein